MDIHATHDTIRLVGISEAVAMSALPANAPKLPAMSEAQRQCLLHILRNNAAALQNTIAMLEREEFSPSPTDLANCVHGVAQSLAQMSSRFETGSYCCLAAEQCEFVESFVGCGPRKEPTINVEAPRRRS